MSERTPEVRCAVDCHLRGRENVTTAAYLCTKFPSESGGAAVRSEGVIHGLSNSAGPEDSLVREISKRRNARRA